MTKDGLTNEICSNIVNVCKSLGGVKSTLETIGEYKSLKTVTAEVKTIREQKELIHREIEADRTESAKLKEQKTAAAAELKIYSHLKEMGFDEATLSSISERSRRFGGPKALLDAIGAFSNLQHIKDEISRHESKCIGAEARRTRAEADHAHLKTIVDIVDTLLYRKGFSINAITGVYDLAERFGDPLKVIKALEKYGNTTKLEDEVTTKTAQISLLAIQKRGLETNVTALRTEEDAIRNSITSLLDGMTSKVNRSLTNVEDASVRAQNNIVSTANNNMAKLDNAHQEYAQKLSDLKFSEGKLEKEVEIAEIIWATLTDPTAAAEFPIAHIRTLINSARLFCDRKSFNPIIPVSNDTAFRSTELSFFAKVALDDLLQWALLGFPESKRG
ncbi:hypothetical protein MUP37_06950 [Candidatus Bathyarchaeota archaeon]|nr:hypothetical protein [Candidatus Bathyarchaeota archaeon]